MTQAELFLIAGYLTNPIRQTHLEIEIPSHSLTRYISKYGRASGMAFPPLSGGPVYVIPPGGDKWGREMRAYFICTDGGALPGVLSAITTVGGRPGYDIYDSRVNSKDLIDPLIEYGFILGSPQVEANIRALIPATHLAVFNAGYALP